MKRHINIITLGCSKNTVDSERIMAQLAAHGWTVAFDGDSAAGGVVVINTCGFIGDAKQESVDMILRCAQAKDDGLIDRLYVIGCLSERYRDELAAELPEVDTFFGVRDITEVVRELTGEWDEALQTERVLSTPPHYAYLKISEGCDRACGYCAIPLIRGPHVSAPIEQLEREARGLAAKGVKELIVIAQDTTYYGIDIYGERRLAELLRRLCSIDGIEWVRLHYAYPAGFPDDVIAVLRDEPKMCKYLDIPLQHISDNQLRSMKRGLGKAGTAALIGKLREQIPGIAIRTTMLVGYPGEAEADFAELREFVREQKFERLGVFPYSEEEGTYSADKLNDDVPDEVKQRRAEELMELQNGISQENNMALIGKRLKVVIDRREDDMWVGRSEYDSPEVDQEVLIPVGKADTGLKPGGFIEVVVTDAMAYDIFAEQVRQ